MTVLWFSSTWPLHRANLGFFTAWQLRSTENNPQYAREHQTSTSIIFANISLARTSDMAELSNNVE